MSERYWFLKNCPLLTSLSGEELRQLESRARSRRFNAGTPIYLPSDVADGVLLLADGRVRIGGASADGKRATLGYIEPGELFGELAVFGGPVRDELAEAMESSLVISLPREEVLRLMNANARLAVGVTKLVGLRRQRIERRLKSLLFRSVRQRLIDLLIELAERYGTNTPEGLLLDIRLSHQELASAIGSTRESVTLVLGELAGEQVLRKRRSRIVLNDLERLSAEVNGSAPARRDVDRKG